MASVGARAKQMSLEFDANAGPSVLPHVKGARAIESDDFPFEAISDLAECESWRKEINRPLSHIHKWWAQRLGSVFRAATIGALAPDDTDVMKLFYSAARFPEAVVFDPFMGSGTTIVETLKLGARAIGRDINPVAYFLVRNAIAVHGRAAVMSTYRTIERDVAEKLTELYQARLPTGELVQVLYYFWVKQLDCPSCNAPVDLFSSRIFARHAYPRRHPEAKACCPSCGGVNSVRYDAVDAKCEHCHAAFDPSHGPAMGQKATCPQCSHEFVIAKTVRLSETPPRHRLYAKLVLLQDGSKAYLAADAFDEALFREAQERLAQTKRAYPVAGIERGYNTDQALNYNYRYWHQFFCDRQLLSIAILADRIRAIREPALRDLFTCLLSGALEFNNMFTSYKGEGTGAVRHMFSHHILKPERTPLEANLWGTSKSSGAFSTLLKSRIIRALDYAEDPFELRIDRHNSKKPSKVFGLSDPIGHDIANSAVDLEGGKRAYLSCGDSSRTDLRAKSVDAVVTDPPFFDNVNYSQLADFFHVWQLHVLEPDGCPPQATTRSSAEVQHGSDLVFAGRLAAVWRECARVLRDDGLLVFSYHHSRTEGWRSVLGALLEAGFVIVASQPVKSEMSVAIPKLQAREPIDLDILLVCRKAKSLSHASADRDGLWNAVELVARSQVLRFRASGRALSKNDVRIILMGQALRFLSRATNGDALVQLDRYEQTIEEAIVRLYDTSHAEEAA